MKYAVINSSRIIMPKNHDKSRCNGGDVVKLAKSIQKLGLLEPITVKPLIGGDGYEIISGNKRYCAMSLLGIKKIPCIVTESQEDNVLIYITLQKYSKHNPFVLADKLKRMLSSESKSAEEIAESLGMDISDFLEYLLPARMSDIERHIALENKLSEETIRNIASVQDYEKRLSILSGYAIKKSASSEIVRKKSVKARRSVATGELKLFENTVKRALALLEKLGYTAQKEIYDNRGETEYKIKLSKS